MEAHDDHRTTKAIRRSCGDRGSSGQTTCRRDGVDPVGSVCALSLLLITLTIAFHLVTRYDWYFGGSFQPWRMLTVQALGTLGAPLLGALIVWRQPTNRYGWVWCLLGLAVAVRCAAFTYEIWAWWLAPVKPFGYQAVRWPARRRAAASKLGLGGMTWSSWP